MVLVNLLPSKAQEECCEMLTPGEDMAVAQINSQQPLLTTQDQAIQNSTINGGGGPQSPLLVVDGC